MTTRAHRANVVRTAIHRRDQLRDLLGRILQVGIQT